MSALFALMVLASTTSVSPIQTEKAVVAPAAQPVFLEVPKQASGLTLYDSKGEVVARCGKKDDDFSDCKMEPGVTLDEVMNAWIHAYKEIQK